MSETARVKVAIHGRVQGVGFRAFVVRHADGLRGTVANADHGGVECVLEGTRERIDEVIAELKVGPSMARVDRVEVSEVVADSPLPATVEVVG